MDRHIFIDSEFAGQNKSCRHYKGKYNGENSYDNLDIGCIILQLNINIYNTLADIAAHDKEHEVCGYLISGQVYIAKNISDNTDKFFEMVMPTVRELCMNIPDDELIFWHSHPKTRPIPSPEDIDFILRTKKPHAIIGLYPFPMVCLYGIEWNGETPLRVVQLEKYKMLNG